MIHIIYQQYPYGCQESFAEDELIILSKRFDDICVYNFSSENNIKRELPHRCKIQDLNGGKKRYIAKTLAFFQLFTPSTVREIGFLKRKWNTVSIKNIKRIYNYYLRRNLVRLNLNNIRVLPGDIIYSYWLSDVAFAGIELRKKCIEIRIISRAHGFDVYKDRGYQPFRREVLRSLDHLFCISESGKTDILKNFGEFITSEKISVSRLGVKICESNYENKPILTKDGYFRIVTCSNVIKLKRLDLVIDALSDIGEKIEWVHIGDGVLMPQIETYAHKKLDNMKNIRWKFIGRVPHNKVMEYYASEMVSLFINCSDYEGVPVSIMEAMMNGIICIGSDVGGTAELFETGNGILLSAPITPKDLSSAIIHVMSMGEKEMLTMRENAIHTIKKKYNAMNNYRKFADELGRK